MWRPSLLNHAKPIVILASGPSLSQSQVDYVQARRDKANVLVINDNYLKIPDADYLYACDDKWWQWHINRPELKAFKGQKITQDIKSAEKYNIEYIESNSRMALSTNPAVIHQGMNSGYQAINLAYHMQPSKVILIGYDMKFAPDGKAHWFGDHPDKVRSNYNGWALGYLSLAEHAKQLNFEIINCTIDTALTCFDRQPLEDVL